MPIDFVFLAQNILVTIIGACSGNISSIFIDRRFFSEQAETLNQQKALEVILSSFKISLYVGAVAFSFACVDTLLAFNYIDIKFIADENLIDPFILGFFVTIIGTLGKAFKTIFVSKDNN